MLHKDFIKAKLKVVPFPSTLSTLMLELCASIMCFTIGNPSPVPFLNLVLASSVR